MAARSRPRVNVVREDFADELNLWNSIVEKIRKANAVNKRYEEVQQNITLAEEALRDIDSTDAKAQLVKYDELEKYWRESVKLTEEESKILHEEPEDLIRNLETLVSVRAALEVDTPRSANTIKPRNLKRRLDADGPNDSPAATPDASTPAPTSRLFSKAASRSGSVAAVSMKSEADGSDIKTAGEKGKFGINAEVFYRTRGKEKEGEGILCRITAIHGDGKQKRYEILDVEPEVDENGVEIQQEPYRAPQQLLQPIPSLGTTLPDLPKGKWVLALYPNTTTFYRAEMVGMRKDQCRLRFEGEDEKDKEQEVDRRYVLDIIIK